ncbi:MAG: hypothetical protein JW912_07620 [Sedimentisphaerales bacterium]|nr:hypothetical protein [Sedimentisphaerales bacterium]
MISIVNKQDADFDGNGELLYKVPEDTAVITIRPKGGFVQLIPSPGSSTVWTIDEDEKFEIPTRDISAKSLYMKKESGQTVSIEILRYSGVLS